MGINLRGPIIGLRLRRVPLEGGIGGGQGVWRLRGLIGLPLIGGFMVGSGSGGHLGPGPRTES